MKVITKSPITVTRPTVNHSQLIKGVTSDGVHPVKPVQPVGYVMEVPGENDKKYLREKLAQAVVGSEEHAKLTIRLELLEDAIIVYKLTRSSKNDYLQYIT